VDGSPRRRAVFLIAGFERDSDRERRVERDGDGESAHIRHDESEGCWSSQRARGVRGNDYLGGGRGAGGDGRAQTLIGCQRPDPRAANALKSSELRDEGSEHLVGLALAREAAEGAGVNARPERVNVLAPEGPDDLGDDKPDGDESLHRPEVGGAGLLAAHDQGGVVSDDGKGRRGDRTNRTGSKRGDAEAEGIEDPRTELQRKRGYEGGDRGDVEDRYNKGGPLKYGVVPDRDRSRKVEDQDERREGRSAHACEKDERPREGDGREPDEQVGALACFDGGRVSPHCAGLTRRTRYPMRSS